MTPSPRFGSRRPAEPFDWPLFFKTFHLQPVPLWLILNALGRPAALAAARLSGASCAGRNREILLAVATVAYLAVVPPLGTAAVYPLLARRRLKDPRHRLIADATFALMLVVSAWYAAALWAKAAPLEGAFGALRVACWP
ncbi:MAG: hypothetical protein KGM24_02075 [Elusimicrobia bacterium]|nr:hypothetical protein [Elusimicrobiota bacterium]